MEPSNFKKCTGWMTNSESEDTTMTDQFPNIKRLGLEVTTITRTGTSYVFADSLEKLLSSAPVVYQYKGASGHGDWSHEIDDDFGGINKYSNNAILVGIQPIVKDSETQSAIEQLQSKLNEAMAKVKEIMEMVDK